MQETDKKLNSVEETATDNPQKNENLGEKSSKKDKKKKSDKHDDSAEKLQEMGEKLTELNDKYLRVCAEYENYRKRTRLEMSDLLLNGCKDTVKAILPVVDDLERALSAISDDNAKEGVTMIYNKLMNTLQQKGLKPMEAVGQKFDENLHEAVTQIPAPSEDQKGTVLDVVEKGYFLNDKVLRYAKVVYAC